jgi:hypothetical protein
VNSVERVKMARNGETSLPDSLVPLVDGLAVVDVGMSITLSRSQSIHATLPALQFEI